MWYVVQGNTGEGDIPIDPVEERLAVSWSAFRDCFEGFGSHTLPPNV